MQATETCVRERGNFIPGVCIIAPLCALIFAACAYLHIAIATYNPLPWLDEWDSLLLISKLQSDPSHWFGLLASQHNEHRIFIPRFTFLVDFWWFGGRDIFNLISIAFVQLSHIVALAWSLRYFSHFSRRERFMLTLAMACLLLSGNQIENFLWGFQVQFVEVYCFATFSLFSLARFAKACKSKKPARAKSMFCLSVLFALCCNYSLANGNLIWLLLLFYLYKSRAYTPRWSLALMALISAVSIAFYFYGYHVPPSQTGLVQLRGFANDFITYLIFYFGGPFRNFGFLAYSFLGMVTIFTVLNLSHYLLFKWNLLTEGEKAYGLIVIFGLGASMSTAMGRISNGVGQAMVSRYSTPVMIMLAAMGIFYWSVSVRGFIKTPAIRGKKLTFLNHHNIGMTASLLISAYTVVSYATPLPIDYYAVQRLKQNAALAFTAGVTEEKIFPIVSPALDPFTIRPFLLREKRSVFGVWPGNVIGRSLQDIASAAPEGTCAGGFAFMSGYVEGEHPGAKAAGWAWSNADRKPVGKILLTDGKRTVIGVAQATASRMDASAAPSVNGKWQGYTAKTDGIVSAYGLTDNFQYCPLGSLKF